MARWWACGISRGCAGRILLRRDHHRHLAAFHARHLLDLGDLIEIVPDPHQHVHAELLVRQFAPAEPHGDFDLVAFLDELVHAAHLDCVVMVVDARTQLDFLDLYNLLLFAGLVLLFLFFVLELSEIEDLADRRISVGRDFNKVQAGIGGHVHRFAAPDDPHHLPAFIDEPNPHGRDFVVDAGTFTGGREVHRWPGYVCSPLNSWQGTALVFAQTASAARATPPPLSV